MSDRYVLDEHHNIHEQPDLMKWARWMGNGSNRVVKQETVNGARVSTVFLGSDHRFGFGGQPILFETMVFGGEHDSHMERCCTWDQALEMHAGVLRMVEESS